MSVQLRDAIRAANRTTIASVSALVLVGTTSLALAEEQVLEEVVVTGIRDALRASIDAKRDAAAVVDAISSEDIGKFPDNNIAESLQRVPGVSINRGFSGEGNDVSIRGVNPELTSVLMNGQYVASTGWFSQGSNKRSFNMDLMPSEMVDRIEVYKSPTALLDEGGVGGTVIVHTRKPLDLDPMTVFLSASTNQVDIDTDKTGSGGTGMISWKNDNENFGILGLISTSETIGRAHKAENYWEEGWSGSGISEFNQDRERDTYDLTVQFAATDQLEFSGHYFNSEQDAANTNQNFLVINAGGRDIRFLPGTESGILASNGLETQGISTGGFANLAVDINSREAKLDTETLHFTADYQTDTLKISGQIGSTEATGGNGGNVNSLWGIPGVETREDDMGNTIVDDMGNDIMYPILLPGGATVELQMNSASSMQLNPVGLDFADGSWQMLRGLPAVATTELTDEEDYAQVDFDFTVEYGPITNIKTGLKLREHTFSNRRFDATYAGTSLVVGTSTLDQWQDGNIDHSGANGALTGSPDKLARITGAFTSEVRGNLGPIIESLAGFGEVEEEITALYAQADFEGDGFSGNFGLRYVKTDVTGTRFNGALTAKEKEKGDYSDFLPSMNLKVDLSEDLVLRLSGSRVMSRPGYSSLSPSFTSFNLPTQQAAKGNINIKPFRATQGDIGLEWYFQEDAIASAIVFYKDIQSFVFNSKLQQTIDGLMFTVDTPTNGRGGVLQGIELQYQQNFGDYGILANYTYVDASGEADDGSSIDLPGASQNTYNLTGYYEGKIFTARLAYSYRSEFLAEGLGIGGSSKFLDQDYLDGSIVFHATENIDVSLEGTNLLGELIRENQGVSGVLRNHSDTGRRYYLKVSARF